MKYFLLTPEQQNVPKSEINKSRLREEKRLLDGDELRFSTNEKLLQQTDSLKCLEGRVVVKMNDKSKDSHTFESGQTIRIERRFNNLNVRETNPVNCIVIDSTYIPAGSEILVHPIELHDSNRIFNYRDNNSDVKYYSLKEEMCFAYHDGTKWDALKGFALALRVFKPYEGMMQGIEPTVISDVLYVTTGEYAGNVVKTLTACDFQLVFQDKNGREGNLIRFRPDGNEKENREPEAIAIMHELTQKINAGKLYVGITTKDCKAIE